MKIGSEKTNRTNIDLAHHNVSLFHERALFQSFYFDFHPKILQKWQNELYCGDRIGTQGRSCPSGPQNSKNWRLCGPGPFGLSLQGVRCFVPFTSALDFSETATTCSSLVQSPVSWLFSHFSSLLKCSKFSSPNPFNSVKNSQSFLERRDWILKWNATLHQNQRFFNRVFNKNSRLSAKTTRRYISCLLSTQQINWFAENALCEEVQSSVTSNLTSPL